MSRLSAEDLRQLAREYNEWLDTPYEAGSSPWDDLDPVYKGDPMYDYDYEIELPEEDNYEELL